MRTLGTHTVAQDHAPVEAGAAELSDERRGVMLSSVSAAILMLLKGYLKSLYGLAEEYVPALWSRRHVLTTATANA
jgi:hypothetical protein